MSEAIKQPASFLGRFLYGVSIGVILGLSAYYRLLLPGRINPRFLVEWFVLFAVLLSLYDTWRFRGSGASTRRIVWGIAIEAVTATLVISTFLAFSGKLHI